MASEITPQRQSFFAEVSGVDLRQPLAAKQWQEIQTAFHEYAILLFRAQELAYANQQRKKRLDSPAHSPWA